MKRLGKGLAELIDPGTQAQAQASGPTSFVMLRLEQIRRAKFQPRTAMSDEGIDELKQSIARSGVIEPVVVRPVGHGVYELVAGERRLRATQALGQSEIPAIIKSLEDKEAAEFALVENIQREDLNPIDEANAYQRLLTEFGYTQEQLGEAVGKNRVTIANMLRLLGLPKEMQRALSEGRLSLGHGKALLGITDPAKQLEAFRQATDGATTVRALEGVAGALRAKGKRKPGRIDAELQALETDLRRVLGTKVRVSKSRKGGRIAIDYYSAEDLARITRLLGAHPS